ncbi:helix-turn-helix domain-containing protein [Streptomyces sp. MMCC 100]|uniref:helix-turn-helix domain-containing protein n=1 Tax=Streptomyces sp. MMCC 100 TaxID=3163555 RepID=UPI003594C0C9
MDARGEQGKSVDPGGEPLPDLLRFWRRRIDPLKVPGLMATGRRGRGLTQNDVARLAGVSVRWYGALERGIKADYSVDFLDQVSSVLRLNPAERRALYLKSVGRPPALAASPGAGAVVPVDATLLQRFLDLQNPAPAFATDLAWNMIAHNQQLRNWFPWTVDQGANLMRWTFLATEAREQLVAWEQDWARPFLGRLRYERAHHPQDSGLLNLERDILAGSSAAREMWDRPDVVEHSHGVLRRLRLPYHQGREAAIRVVALRPMRSDTLRVVVLLEGPECADGI